MGSVNITALGRAGLGPMIRGIAWVFRMPTVTWRTGSGAAKREARNSEAAHANRAETSGELNVEPNGEPNGAGVPGRGSAVRDSSNAIPEGTIAPSVESIMEEKRACRAIMASRVCTAVLEVVAAAAPLAAEEGGDE